MQHVTRLPAKHTRVYNQLKDGGETGPGVNSDVSDYNSELLSEALPQLSHDWPCLSRGFFGRQHVFWHSLSCRLSALIATVTSCFLEQGSTDDVHQLYVAGGIERRFLKDLVSICQSCSLGSGWLFSISGVGGPPTLELWGLLPIWSYTTMWMI